jgi:hypothetical protein
MARMRRAREEEDAPDEPEPEPPQSPGVRDSLIEFGRENMPSWAKKLKAARPVPIAVDGALEDDEPRKIMTPREILRKEHRERRQAAQENRAKVRGDPPPPAPAPAPSATDMSVQDRYALYNQQYMEAKANKMRAEGEVYAPPPAAGDRDEELNMLATALELPSFEDQDADDGFDANDGVVSYRVGDREVTFPVGGDDNARGRMIRESLEAEIGPEKLAKVLDELRACEAGDDTAAPTLDSLDRELIILVLQLFSLTRDEK